MPDARIVEAPKQCTYVDNDDKTDDHATEELELGVDTACPDVVLGSEIVAAKEDVLQNIDTSNRKPAKHSDERHDKDLVEQVLQFVGQARNYRKSDEHAGDEEDSA